MVFLMVNPPYFLWLVHHSASAAGLVLPRKMGDKKGGDEINYQQAWDTGVAVKSEVYPSGYVKIAIERCHRNSRFSHRKW